MEQIGKDFQSINLAFPTPLKEGGFDVEIIVKQHEEHMKFVKEKINLTSFEFSKVAKSEMISGVCTLRLPSYLDTINKMRLDREISKN